jgi:glycosyltransferase involved in cell wall biosynthesis
VAERILVALKSTPVACMVMRGSAHIWAQDSILRDEEHRTGVRIERPKPSMIAREQREYALADRIIVLSSFAYKSFITEGADPARVRCLPLGASLATFRPTADVIEARRQRILSGAPLLVLYTGAVSLQKGFWDLASVARESDGGRFRFRCVGKVTPEARRLAADLDHLIEFTPKQPQPTLPSVYAAADVFLFPTQQDGFAVVLAQANAAGLPIITTPNCCGPDLIEENKTGWIVPIRDPQAIIDRLHWCDTHRKELADMVQYTSAEFQPRDWDDVAADFEQLCAEAAAEKNFAMAGVPFGR